MVSLGIVLAVSCIARGEGVPTAGVAALLSAGRYEAAEPAARAGVAALRPAGGAPLAAALEDQAAALVRNGRVAGHEAERSAREALEIRTRIHGAHARDSARAFTVLGAALVAQGSFQDAAAPIDEAVARLSPDGEGLAEALLVRAELRIAQGDLAGAQEAARRALDLARAGAGDPSTEARALDLQASALQWQHDWTAAASAARTAASVRAVLGPVHGDSASTLLLMGDGAWSAGEMGAAGEYYGRAVRLAADSLRVGHPLAIRAGARLALWHATSGQLDLALPEYQRALELARATLGADHPQRADYLNDYANALVRSGDGEAAVPVYEEVARITQAAYGPESPRVATPLHNLGWAYAEQGEWARAALPLERALRLWRTAYGDGDARVSLGRGDLADVLAADGRDAEAVSYFGRAIGARVLAGEADHPQTASLEGRLAQSLARLGRTTEAERHAARAEARLLPVARWRDREFAEVVALRARLGLADPARRAFALDRAADADELMRRHVRSTVRFLGDRQALEYVDHRFAGRDAVLAYLSEHPGDGAAARTGLDLVARSRNLVLDELASRSAHGAVTGEGAAALERASLAAQRLTGHFLRGVAHASDSVLREARDDYDAAAREAALSLVRPPAPEFAGDLVAALSGRLQPAGALVSICSYRTRRTDAESYLAFVLVRGARVPAVVPLGPAAPLDGLVREWQAAVDRLARTREGGGLRADLDGLGRRLGAALWTPIARQLRGVSRVVLVPDGSLNLVNFAALVDASGRYVLESGPTLHLASAERDLLREAPAPHEQRLLVLANPAFEDPRALQRSLATPPPPAAAIEEAPPAAPNRGLAPCDRLSTQRFGPLPASQREAEALRDLWVSLGGAAPVLLDGSAAAEGALKRAAPGHSIVHVATHGFVAEPRCPGAPHEHRPRVSPLLLSGVVLAGANRRRDAAPTDDDGLLTAEEIAGLDLRQADWVVLSACDTGRGEVRASEGVLGLRRALAVAGARTVIMSLWAVADDDARLWMIDLYTARFAQGLDTAAAVREASLRALARLRAEGAADDPSRWAAFVAAGDPRSAAWQ